VIPKQIKLFVSLLIFTVLAIPVNSADLKTTTTKLSCDVSGFTNDTYEDKKLPMRKVYVTVEEITNFSLSVDIDGPENYSYSFYSSHNAKLPPPYFSVTNDLSDANKYELIHSTYSKVTDLKSSVKIDRTNGFMKVTYTSRSMTSDYRVNTEITGMCMVNKNERKF